MKKLRSAILLLNIFLLSTNYIFAFEVISTSELLLSYLKNDNNLKKNAIDAKKAQLALDSTRIDNEFDITLSTGNITIKTSNDGNSVSINPNVKATIPQASNLTVSASSNFIFGNDATKKSSSNSSSLENVKLNASIDIIGSSTKERNISLLKAERTFNEATRKLKNQAVNTEKAFYTELKSLLNDTESIINLKKSLYNSKMDFEKIKVQEYAKESPTYRLAQMKVASLERDIENATRDLIRSYMVFYKKCGHNISLEKNIDFFNLIPTDIAEVEPIDIHSFKEDSYSEVENALWVNKINSMQRKINKTFSLAADGGVTFNNTTTSSTTIDACLSSKIGGVNLAAGVNVPVTESSSPVFTFSATVSPNTFKKNNITKQQNNLLEEQELLEIETARSNYATKVVDCEQSLSNLLWSKQTNQESYELYSKLEKDLAKWYAQGIITESEYYSAEVNAQSYFVKNIINKIDFIIYNNNIVTMFVDENL